jgi:hypothetical protein
LATAPTTTARSDVLCLLQPLQGLHDTTTRQTDQGLNSPRPAWAEGLNLDHHHHHHHSRVTPLNSHSQQQQQQQQHVAPTRPAPQQAWGEVSAAPQQQQGDQHQQTLLTQGFLQQQQQQHAYLGGHQVGSQFLQPQPTLSVWNTQVQQQHAQVGHIDL